MANRFIALMAAVLALGLVVTGCGDDESSNGGGDTAAQTITDTEVETVTDDEVVTDTETETVTDETDTDVTSDNGGAVVPEAAVERCKEGVEKTSQLSGDAKESLQDLCEKAGSGNREDLKKAIVEVCKKQAANIPEGVPGRDRAMAACEQAGK